MFSVFDNSFNWSSTSFSDVENYKRFNLSMSILNKNNVSDQINDIHPDYLSFYNLNFNGDMVSFIPTTPEKLFNNISVSSGLLENTPNKPQKRKYNKKPKPKEVKYYDGFKYFNMNHVNYEINEKLHEVLTDPLEKSFASFVANKILMFNKSFDYISSNQLVKKLNISKSKVISLQKELEKKKVILSYLDESVKGNNKRYYFLNTDTYAIINKSLKIGLLPIKNLLKFNSQFEKELSKIKFHLSETKNANSDLLYSNFRSKRDKAYDDLAKHLKEQIDKFEGSICEIHGEYSINTRVVFVKYGGSICEIPTIENITIENYLIEKQQQEKKETENLKTQNECSAKQKNDVVVVPLENFENKEENIISENKNLEEEFFKQQEELYKSSLEKINEEKEMSPKGDKDADLDLDIVTSKPKDDLTHISEDVGISDKKNIPSGGGADCGQNVDKVSDEHISNELIEDLINVGFGVKKSKELIEIYGIQNVRECLDYCLDEKEAGHIHGLFTGYMLGCFKNEFKKVEDSPKEIKKQSDKNKDDLKPVLEFFNVSKISSLERELKPFLNLYETYKVNINDRVMKKIEDYKSSPEVIKFSKAKTFGIENVNEEHWFDIIKISEEAKEQRFNSRLSELRNLNIASIEALKSFINKNKLIFDKGLFDYE